VELDLTRRTACSGEGELHLTPLEYRVLECLARNPGMIVTQRQLLREAWGPDRSGDSRSLRVCIRNLRAKLEPDPARPRYIATEAGLGYRLKLDEPGGADGHPAPNEAASVP
jgi:two-component system KDP operon response regulator KdpE